MGERKYMLSVHNKIKFCGNNFAFLSSIFIGLVSIAVGFDSFAIVGSCRPLK